MQVVLTKLSDTRHRLSVTRDEGSSEAIELDTRSFLFHDLAHFAVERVFGIESGFWGCIARGGSLAGKDLVGAQLMLAEKISGPVQTLLRLEADVHQIRQVLGEIVPELASDERAKQLHEELRRLRGHWAATPYGGQMRLTWPQDPAPQIHSAQTRRR